MRPARVACRIALLDQEVMEQPYRHQPLLQRRVRQADIRADRYDVLPPTAGTRTQLTHVPGDMRQGDTTDGRADAGEHPHQTRGRAGPDPGLPPDGSSSGRTASRVLGPGCAGTEPRPWAWFVVVITCAPFPAIGGAPLMWLDGPGDESRHSGTAPERPGVIAWVSIAGGLSRALSGEHAAPGAYGGSGSGCRRRRRPAGAAGALVGAVRRCAGRGSARGSRRSGRRCRIRPARVRSPSACDRDRGRRGNPRRGGRGSRRSTWWRR